MRRLLVVDRDLALLDPQLDLGRHVRVAPYDAVEDALVCGMRSTTPTVISSPTVQVPFGTSQTIVTRRREPRLQIRG